MGNLAKDLQSAENLSNSRTRICSIGKMLVSLDKEDREALTKVLADPLIESSSIARVLDKNGISIGGDLIRRHRRRANGNGCMCPKDL